MTVRSQTLLIKVVHNPGNIPDPQLFVDANVTVVCDMSWTEYLEAQPALQNLTQSALQNDTSRQTSIPSRQDLSYMINQVPSDWQRYQVNNFVMEILQGAAWIFVTDSNMGSSPTVSQGWGDDWESFVAMMQLNPPSRT